MLSHDCVSFEQIQHCFNYAFFNFVNYGLLVLGNIMIIHSFKNQLGRYDLQKEEEEQKGRMIKHKEKWPNGVNLFSKLGSRTNIDKSHHPQDLCDLFPFSNIMVFLSIQAFCCMCWNFLHSAGQLEFLLQAKNQAPDQQATLCQSLYINLVNSIRKKWTGPRLLSEASLFDFIFPFFYIMFKVP